MKILEIEGAELAIDRHGPVHAPALLLIAGGAQSMDWWTPGFCEAVSAGGLHVIRYDHRDTGRSTSSPPGRPSYSAADLAADPLRILDALAIRRAHLVGMSTLGGGIAQTVAVQAPERVLSLTLISTSPDGGDPGPLPPPSVDVVHWDQPRSDVDWSDMAAVIAYRVDAERPYAAPGAFDEPRVRALSTLEVRRTRDMASSMGNHCLAAPRPPVDPAEIRVPTLVIHSVDDPKHPFAHGEALASMIPGATLLRLHGVGHEVPPPAVWHQVVPALHEHALSA